ncbi:hypothetical protein FRC16_004673 [Serendipita sp. 398]|nr:hypothetical protein FRC16_004673 [Serendipita sp. 398]
MSQNALFKYEDGQGITFCVHKQNPRLKELVELINNRLVGHNQKANGGDCIPHPKPGTFCIFFQANPTISEEISLLKSQGTISTTIAWIYESILSGQLLPWYQYQIGVEEKDSQLDVLTRDLRELAMCIARHSQMFFQPDDAYRHLARRFPHRTSDGFREVHQQHQDVVQSMIDRVVASIDRLVLSVDFPNSNNTIDTYAGHPIGGRQVLPNTLSSPTSLGDTLSQRTPAKFGSSRIESEHRRTSISFRPQTLISQNTQSPATLTFGSSNAPLDGSPRSQSSSEEQDETDYETESSDDEQSSGNETFRSPSDCSENSGTEVVGRKRKRGTYSDHQGRATKRRRTRSTAQPSKSHKPATRDLALIRKWLKKRPIENSSSRSEYWREFSEKAPTSTQRPWRSWQYVYWNYILPSQDEPTAAPPPQEATISPGTTRQTLDSPGAITATSSPTHTSEIARRNSLLQSTIATPGQTQATGASGSSQLAMSSSMAETSRKEQQDQHVFGASTHAGQVHRKSASQSGLQTHINASFSFPMPLKDDPLTSVTSSVPLDQEDIHGMNPDQKIAYLDKIQATHVGKCFKIPKINPGSWAVWNRFVQVNPSLNHGADFWQRRYHERENTILKAGFHMFIPPDSAL